MCPWPNRSIKFSTQQHSVSKHSHHLITSDITIVCITISLASCDSSPSCHCAARVPLPITFPLLFSLLRSSSSFPPLALLFASFIPLVMLCFSHPVCYRFNVFRLQLHDGMRQQIITVVVIIIGLIVTIFMDQLAQYSDSDDEPPTLFPPPPSRLCPAHATAGSADASAAHLFDTAAASGSSLSLSAAAAGTIPISTGPSSFAAVTVRYKCPGCLKTFANTGGVIKHLKSVSDPSSCSYDGEHPKITCPITTVATQVNCMLSAEGQWVIQQPSKVPVSGSPWREIMGYHNSSASVSKASDGNAPALCSINVLLQT